MDAYVELLKQSIELLYHIIEIKYCDKNGVPKKINKDNAVIGGNLTRLVKLNTSFLQNICESKLEICYIISRCIAETSINLKFILISGEERVIKNYIKYSLLTEKELWEVIIENIKQRNGETLQIENRMQKSIQNSFDKSDFEIEEINRSSKWKSIKERAKVVAGEQFYSVFYGISSHSIHGNWQDIILNNLKKIEEGFELNLDWNKPRPQIIDGPIGFNLEIVKTFCEKELTTERNYSLINEKLKILNKYHYELIETHEEFMKKWND